jgi:membrane-bound lytic murein transglycosylase B
MAEPSAATGSDATVAELQSRLLDLGYYDGRVDGNARRDLRDALTKFQRAHGLPVSGEPDARTVRVLRESYCF